MNREALGQLVLFTTEDRGHLRRHQDLVLDARKEVYFGKGFFLTLAA
jgi:hypothetical protein